MKNISLMEKQKLLMELSKFRVNSEVIDIILLEYYEEGVHVLMKKNWAFLSTYIIVLLKSGRLIKLKRYESSAVLYLNFSSWNT